jgi:Mrp family chromosome partitioning ATPase
MKIHHQASACLLALSTLHAHATDNSSDLITTSQEAPVATAPALSSAANSKSARSTVTVASAKTPADSSTAAERTDSTSNTGATASTTPGVTKETAPQSLAIDLATLEERLVDTDAIGFFTKLELKSQLDDLTTKFKAFHEAGSKEELPELREEFDLLLLKLLTLLQDEDPSLHHEVATARPEIWRTFSDPALFAQL